MTELEFPGGTVPMPTHAEPVPGMREPVIHCPYCGEPCDGTVTVEYDAMVDGAGCVESEERCDACVDNAAERQQVEADEAYYGGDSPGSYGPDDPGAFGGR